VLVNDNVKLDIKKSNHAILLTLFKPAMLAGFRKALATPSANSSAVRSCSESVVACRPLRGLAAHRHGHRQARRGQRDRDRRRAADPVGRQARPEGAARRAAERQGAARG
jgi:hypothetical protein